MKSVAAKALLVLALACFASPLLRAQVEQPGVAAPSAETAAVDAGGTAVRALPVARVPNDPLPVQAAPPRTLRAYWHVYIAFTIAWLLVFGYALSIGRGFARVERDLLAAEARAGVR